MTDHPHWGGTIRKLWPSESDKLRDHMLRLDAHSRRLRFAHAVSDSFIIEYVARTPAMGSIIYAYLENGTVRAVAELRRLGLGNEHQAEAAFSVEADWQNRGIGSELMGLVIRSAQNRNIQRLVMACMVENRKIQNVARKYNAEITFEHGDAIGILSPDDATYLSQLEERIDDRFDFMIAVLNINQPEGKVVERNAITNSI